MEEEKKEPQESQTANEPSRTKVGFPQSEKEKPKSNKKLIFIILLLILLLGAGAWYLFSGSQNGLVTDEESPTPTTVTVEETPTPTESLSEPERDGVDIQVLNGSGIPGAAADLQKKLEDLGYSGIDVGNASSQNQTKTTVTFDESVSEEVRKEILDTLEKTYEEVEDSEKSLTNYDIVITVGYTKGYKATTTPTGKPVSTSTPSILPTGSPSVTVTTTPTP